MCFHTRATAWHDPGCDPVPLPVRLCRLGGAAWRSLGPVPERLQRAWVFARGGERDKYVSLQRFMKQSNADIHK